ncbi:MAG: hydroxymethylglutaryl-coenzyme A synthase C terminal-domain-containing protein [Piptocephalis tieghemiana]|nr:MAG: hydroxymethylglutaryl-coenzyme A synthase C terminal-domain-containing protein [Piptocephalis tieghemiana]
MTIPVPLSPPSPSSRDNVGIVGMELYFPKRCVEQAALESFDGVSSGKYTIGLGQTKMAFTDDREDIHSICLTVVQSLVEKYHISYTDIGRLEVGTETIVDKAKSCKSVLMQLFAESGNHDVEGIDTTNACYGGTSALLNSLAWIESSSWDGRYAVVVAGDLAYYASGPARPTGGAGVVAMLLGPNAPLTIEPGLRSTYMEHTYDFYKPDLSSEFPEVDGPLTVECYLRALDRVYTGYLDKLGRVKSSSETEAGKPKSIADIDHILFHAPYSKLVQKAHGRLFYNDFLRDPSRESSFDASVQSYANVSEKASYFDRALEKAFMTLSSDSFSQKTLPSLHAAKQLGNMYCGSVYGALASLISMGSPQIGERIALFSYGSGLAATMFSIRVTGNTDPIRKALDLSHRLDSRVISDPSHFDEVMRLREETHQLKSYSPVGSLEHLFPGTYYLEHVDDKFRRSYKRIPLSD